MAQDCWGGSHLHWKTPKISQKPNQNVWNVSPPWITGNGCDSPSACKKSLDSQNWPKCKKTSAPWMTGQVWFTPLANSNFITIALSAQNSLWCWLQQLVKHTQTEAEIHTHTHTHTGWLCQAAFASSILCPLAVASAPAPPPARCVINTRSWGRGSRGGVPLWVWLGVWLWTLGREGVVDFLW